ncbi:MAG TPA: hypothetical protein VFD91_06235 [Mariniphaga sp.]|nr:hypothetical protein [Mariniphaga sp.]
MKLLRLGITFLFIFIVVALQGQETGDLFLEGTITLEGSSTGEAEIGVYQDGRLLNNFKIGNRGNFRLQLLLNNDYAIIFNHSGYFSQKLTFNTKVPAVAMPQLPASQVFSVNIKLFPEVAGVDKAFFDKPVMNIYYNEKTGKFISDVFYSNSQIGQFIDQTVTKIQQPGGELDNKDQILNSGREALKKEYDQHIRQAEIEYNREEFVAALDGYQAAAKILPEEQYPKDRIAEINDLLGLLMIAEEMDKALKERMITLLSQGDRYFDQKNYEQAKSAYQRALSVEPDNDHALQKLDTISDIQQQIQKEKQYISLIKAADNSFDDLLYAEANNLYSQALELNDSEEHPKQQLQRIEEILKQQTLNAEKLKGYRESIFQAELHYDKQFYDKAISYYENALNHKPGDEVATLKIKEIKELMQQFANQSLYEKRLKTADRAFQKMQYEEALAEYEAAAVLMPQEEHPQLRISEIRSHFDEQKRLAAEAEAEKARKVAEAAEQARLASLEAEKEKKYKKAIAVADSLFGLQDYEGALVAFNLAQQEKPEGNYPQQRIEEIKKLQEQFASIQQIYDASINTGNEAFEKELFEDARNSFLEAQKIKPEESYPVEMLVQIDSIVDKRAQLAAQAEAEKKRLEAVAAEQARLIALEEERETKYREVLATGDSLFRLQDYEGAVTALQSAQQVKPEETFPAQRIEEIIDLLQQLAATQQAYDAAVAKADAAFKIEKLKDARIAYEEAHQLKPLEAYPDERIAQIDSLEEARAQQFAQAEAEKKQIEAEAAEQARIAALEAEKENKYREAIALADSLFLIEEYEESLTAWQLAQQLKPEEDLPKQKIEEINKLLEQYASLKQAYNTAVNRGDAAFAKEQYDDATDAYKEALKLRPEEEYPVEMLAKVDSMVELRARLVAQAEAEKERLAAEAAEQARLAALEAEKEKSYKMAVLIADSLFNIQNYSLAKEGYQKALVIDVEAIYPKQRIDEIDQLIVLESEKKQQELLEQEFQVALNRANEYFQKEDYVAAIADYRRVLELKPEEEFARLRIVEADRLLQQQALDEQYAKIILAADGYYSKKEWENSQEQYENALEIKPEDQYPREQLSKIDNILKQQAEQLLAEQQAEAEEERNRLEMEQQLKLEQERQNMNDTGLDLIYNDFLTNADKFFENKSYNVARAWYYKALDVKHNESYPAEQIVEINTLVKASVSNQRDRDYQNLIDRADSSFRANQLAVARGWYNRALSLKGDEQYPKEQLEEISRIIAERLTGKSEMLFGSYMEQAGNSYETGSYNVSRYWLKKALELRPDHSEALEQFKEIELKLK